jgi:hypothetical protein
MLIRRVLVPVAALFALASAPTSLEAASPPKRFAGNVCGLLATSHIPAGYTRVCTALAPEKSLLDPTTYSAVFGGKTFDGFTPRSRVFLISVARSGDADSQTAFKGISGTLASIYHTKRVPMDAGTWGREVQYVGKGHARFAEVTFLAGGYEVTNLWANSSSRSDRLAVARAVADSLG